METTYEFTAYNSEKLYGYGTEDEAQLYLDHLNKDRDINLYEYEASDLTDDEADPLAFGLRDELLALDLI
jgi:hypothetical protein